LGRLRTLAMLMSVGAWGAAADGAVQGGGPPDAPAARPPAPVPPVEYLRAGAQLFNNGEYDLAADYLQAARDYADQLTPGEQARLAEYEQAMRQVSGQTPAASNPRAEASRPAQAAAAPEADYPTNDKSAARWLLVSAREDIARGDYATAQGKIDQARRMDVRWRLFDDVTPNKVQKQLDKAKPEAAAIASRPAPEANPRSQKAAAEARLAQARKALEQGEYNQAEAIALEVEGWGLRYGPFEDSPQKVAAAARALRARDGLRANPSRQNDQSTYDLLVREARALMERGELEPARSKALHALRLNVVPPVDADRAESILYELERIGDQGGAPENALANRSPLGTPGAPAAAAETGRTDPNVQATQERVELPESDAAADRPDLDLPDLEPADEAGNAAPAVFEDDEETDPADSRLQQARALLASGNYDAARETAREAGQAGAAAEAEELISQIDLAEQAAALTLYESALAASRSEDYARAKAMLEQVASMESALDDSLQQRVEDLLLKLPTGDGQGEPKGALESELDAEAIAAQQLNAEVGAKVAEARRLLDMDPDEAIAMLEETKASVDAAQLSAPVTRTMIRRLDVAIARAKEDKVAIEAKKADKEDQAEAQRTKLRILEADTAKQEQIKEMMEKAMAADRNGDHAAAEMWAKRVVAIDPNNVAATTLATVARAKRNFEEDRRIRDAKEQGVLSTLLDVDRTSVIDPKVLDRGITFPESFLEMTEGRERFAQVEPYKSPETLAVEERLNETIDRIEMPNGTLEEALDFIRNYTGLNIVPDMRGFQDEAITLQEPVNIKATDIKLKTVLKFILEPHGLTYDVREGVLVITTPQSRGDTLVRVYQVADLVVAPKHPDQRDVIGQAATPVVDGQPVAMPYGSQDPLMSGAANSAGPSVAIENREVDFGPLIQMITTSIAPGTWDINNEKGESVTGGFGLGAGGGGGGFGGGFAGDEEPPIGTITPFLLNISLIIRHTAEVHDEIVDLLRQLRRLQDLQVSVEVRFITVNDDFFEFIGVDFDFSIQSDLFGKGSSFVVPNPAATPVPPGAGGGGGGGGGGAAAAPPFLVNPQRDSSLGNRQPLVLGVGSPGNIGSTRFSENLGIQTLQDSFTPSQGLLNIVPGAGSTFGISFLSDLEVFLFMSALQGNTRANVVQAPKITTFNGATASIADQTQRFLVTGLNPIVSAGAVAFQPQVQGITDGVQLFVTPVVTADRRYVRLTLSPFFQVIQGVDTFSFGGGAVGGGGLGGGAANIQSTLQLPIVSNTFVNTTVTVPDGGTVLLGGVKRLTEQRLEFGTPILSKIPTINRLFRNIGIGRTTDSLMLMVTPRIIILEEEEEALGIPAVPTTGLP